MKACTNKDCQQVNPQSESAFKVDSKTKKLKSNCRYCEAKAVKRWRQSNPLKFKGLNLKRYWPGLSSEECLQEYNSLLKNQDNKCNMCQKHQSELKFTLCVDHCHVTGKVRGLLCDNCNQALGLLKDSIPTLLRAIKHIDDTAE